MKMLVTGASGFLGSHAVEALLDAGHEVRASARSAERVRKALEPLGVADRVEIVEADVTDRERVRTALAGCDGVLHAAAIYSLDARDAKRMLEDNIAVTENVLGLAAELELDPIIHVSSYGALVPCVGTMTADSPLGEGAPPYQRSKAESERVARRLQDEGAPVVIVQPGMVWGPDDPAAGETTQLVRATLARKIPMAPKGLVPIVDVRDVARVFAAAAQPGKGPRRYLACGELVEMLDVFRIAADAGGVKPPRGRMPAGVALIFGRIADAAQRLIPVRLPASYQGLWVVANGPTTLDASPTTAELGISFRPAEETIRDTVAWIRNDAT